MSVDYLELIKRNICLICGAKDCSQIEKNPNYKKMMDAYRKGDMGKVKGLYMKGFAQYAGMNQGIYRSMVDADDMSKKIKDPTSLGLFWNYVKGEGKDYTLDQLSLKNRVIDKIHEKGAFNKEGSISSRFLSQVKNGERLEFNNVYNFGEGRIFSNDPMWAIGSANIRGKLTDIKFTPKGSGYILEGNIHYRFHDKFTDAFDTLNLTKGEWNPPPTKPFNINGSWTEKVRMPLTESEYKNIKKIVR